MNISQLNSNLDSYISDQVYFLEKSITNNGVSDISRNYILNKFDKISEYKNEKRYELKHVSANLLDVTDVDLKNTGYNLFNSLCQLDILRKIFSIELDLLDSVDECYKELKFSLPENVGVNRNELESQFYLKLKLIKEKKMEIYKLLGMHFFIEHDDEIVFDIIRLNDSYINDINILLDYFHKKNKKVMFYIPFNSELRECPLQRDKLLDLIDSHGVQLGSASLQICSERDLKLLEVIADKCPSMYKLKLSRVSFTNLRTILPAKLISLVVTDSPNLEKLELDLPDTLEKLELVSMKKLNNLPGQFPHSMDLLIMNKCDSISKIDVLPSKIKKLEILSCKKLCKIDALLTGIAIKIHDCDELEEIPEKFSDETTSIEIHSCPNLTKFPLQWPKSLRQLSIKDGLHITELPVLFPERIEEVYLSNLNKILSIPEKLPESLKKLTIHLEGLLQFPKTLPKNMEYLDIYHCKRLLNVCDSFPDTLKFFRAFECTSLVEIPTQFPNTLAVVDLGGSSLLSRFPNQLPDQLGYLNLEGCELIPSIPDKLPENMREVNLVSCRALGNLPTIYSPKVVIIIDKIKFDELATQKEKSDQFKLVESEGESDDDLVTQALYIEQSDYSIRDTIETIVANVSKTMTGRAILGTRHEDEKMRYLMEQIEAKEKDALPLKAELLAILKEDVFSSQSLKQIALSPLHIKEMILRTRGELAQLKSFDEGIEPRLKTKIDQLIKIIEQEIVLYKALLDVNEMGLLRAALRKSLKAIGGKEIQVSVDQGQVKLSGNYVSALGFLEKIVKAGGKIATVQNNSGEVAKMLAFPAKIGTRFIDFGTSELSRELRNLGLERMGYSSVYKEGFVFLVSSRDRLRFPDLDNATSTFEEIDLEKQRSLDRGTVITVAGLGVVYELSCTEILSFLMKGLNVVAFNYRGVGDSTGISTGEGFKRDVEAIYQYVHSKGVPDNRIIFKGLCMGGGPATFVAANHPGTHLFLDQSFSRIHKVVEKVVENRLNRVFHADENASEFEIHLKNTLKELSSNIVNHIAKMGEPDFNNDKYIRKVEGMVALLVTTEDALLDYNENAIKNLNSRFDEGKQEKSKLYLIGGRHAQPWHRATISEDGEKLFHGHESMDDFLRRIDLGDSLL